MFSKTHGHLTLPTWWESNCLPDSGLPYREKGFLLLLSSEENLSVSNKEESVHNQQTKKESSTSLIARNCWASPRRSVNALVSLIASSTEKAWGALATTHIDINWISSTNKSSLCVILTVTTSLAHENLLTFRRTKFQAPESSKVQQVYVFLKIKKHILFDTNTNWIPVPSDSYLRSDARGVMKCEKHLGVCVRAQKRVAATSDRFKKPGSTSEHYFTPQRSPKIFKLKWQC